MAGAVIAEVAREKNLSLEEMRAKGFGPDEIEAILTKKSSPQRPGLTQHKDGRGRSAEGGRPAAKKLGALAYPLRHRRRRLPLTRRLPSSIPTIGKRSGISGKFICGQATFEAAKTAFERLIALHSAVENPYFIHWSFFRLGDVEAGLGRRDRSAASKL